MMLCPKLAEHEMKCVYDGGLDCMYCGMTKTELQLRERIAELEEALARQPAEVCEMCGEELEERLATPADQFIPADEVFRKYGLET